MKQFPRGEMKTRRNHGGCNFLRVVYTFARLAKKKKNLRFSPQMMLNIIQLNAIIHSARAHYNQPS